MGRSVVTEFYRQPGGRTQIFGLTVTDGGSRTLYDVELSRRFGYIYHVSGMGGFPLEVSGMYHVSGDLEGEQVVENPATWVAAGDNPPFRSPKTQAIRKINRTRQVKLPREFRGAPDVLEWLRDNGIESNAVFCSTCRDWFPDYDWDYCEHMWWCDRNGVVSTPQERCKCKSRDECRDDEITPPTQPISG